MNICAATILGLGLAFGAAAQAQEVTPRATGLALEVIEGPTLIFAVAEHSSDPNARLGFALTCDWETGGMALHLHFGAFPSNKPVQAAIRTPDGKILRLGPVLRAPGPSAGYHDPVFTNPATVLEAGRALFTTGSLMSNGHNSVWLELPEQLNRTTLARITECSGGS